MCVPGIFFSLPAPGTLFDVPLLCICRYNITQFEASSAWFSKPSPLRLRLSKISSRSMKGSSHFIGKSLLVCHHLQSCYNDWDCQWAKLCLWRRRALPGSRLKVSLDVVLSVNLCVWRSSKAREHLGELKDRNMASGRLVVLTVNLSGQVEVRQAYKSPEISLVLVSWAENLGI